VRSLFAVLVLLWMVLSAPMRPQLLSSVSCWKKGVFILSAVPRDTSILPQTPSSNRYEKRYELSDFHTLQEWFHLSAPTCRSFSTRWEILGWRLPEAFPLPPALPTSLHMSATGFPARQFHGWATQRSHQERL